MFTAPSWVAPASELRGFGAERLDHREALGLRDHPLALRVLVIPRDREMRGVLPHRLVLRECEADGARAGAVAALARERAHAVARTRSGKQPRGGFVRVTGAQLLFRLPLAPAGHSRHRPGRSTSPLGETTCTPPSRDSEAALKSMPFCSQRRTALAPTEGRQLRSTGSWGRGSQGRLLGLGPRGVYTGALATHLLEGSDRLLARGTIPTAQRADGLSSADGLQSAGTTSRPNR